jgi:hypothetical protein
MDEGAADDRWQAFADLMDRLVKARPAGKTICPSEVARAAAGPAGDWRGLMPLVHRVAEAQAAAGRVVLTQKGQVVDGLPRGAYRIGRPPEPAEG